MSTGNDKEVKIGITAQTAGADEAKQALEQVKDAAEKAGEGTSEASKVASEGLKEVASAAKDAEEAVESLTSAQKELSLAAAGATDELSAYNLAFDDALIGGDSPGEAAEAGREAIEVIRQRTDATAELGEQQKKTKLDTEDLKAETKELNEESRQMRAKLVGEGLEKAGEMFGKLAAVLNEVSVEMREVNPELAESAGQAAKVADGLGSIATGAAVGMMTFGPVGAAVGATVGLLGELGRAWLEMEADAAKANAKITAELDKLKDRLVDVAIERDRIGHDKFREQLEKEADAYRRIGEEVTHTIRLERARRDANDAIFDAKDRMELATLDADESIPEAEKIKRRAEIRERGERRQTAGKLQDLNDQDRQADADVAQAEENAKAKEEAAAQAAEEVAKAEARKKELMTKAEAAEQLRNAIKLEEQASQGIAGLDFVSDFIPNIGPGFLARKVINKKNEGERDEFTAKAKSARESIDELHESGNVATLAEERELKVLQDSGIDERKKTAEEAAAAAEAARLAAKEAAEKRNQTRQITAAERQGIVVTAPIDAQARNITTDSQVERAEKRAEEDANRQKEKEEREKDRANKQREAEENRVAGLGRQAESRSDMVAKSLMNTNPRIAELIDEAGNAVEDNPSAENFKILVDLLKKTIEHLKADRQQQNNLREVLRDVENLQGEAVRSRSDVTHNNKK